MPRSSDIQAMFTGISGRYDLLNHLLSFGLDGWWWRRMARASGAAPGRRILDVAAGTGDSSLALARRGAEVLTSDFTLAMLHRGPTKFRRSGLDSRILGSVGADAQCLPFRDASFDGVTICYGIRNVEDRARAYGEFLRVLRSGGQLTILEFSRPRWGWLRLLNRAYGRWFLPLVGGLLSPNPSAYQYLPDSIQAFPDQAALADELRAAGFEGVRWMNLSGGIVALHVARKRD